MWPVGKLILNSYNHMFELNKKATGGLKPRGNTNVSMK